MLDQDDEDESNNEIRHRLNYKIDDLMYYLDTCCMKLFPNEINWYIFNHMDSLQKIIRISHDQNSRNGS